MANTEAKSKILIVDDEPDMRELLREFFSELDVEIAEAADGKEAWTYLIKNKVDLVVTDINMPNMNGLELCQKIAEKRMPTSMIIVTGHGGVQECMSAMKYGVFDVISKPFEQELIMNRVKNAIEIRRVSHAMNGVFQLLSKELGLKEKRDFESMPCEEQVKFLNAITSLASMRFLKMEMDQKRPQPESD